MKNKGGQVQNLQKFLGERIMELEKLLEDNRFIEKSVVERTLEMNKHIYNYIYGDGNKKK